MKANKNNEMEGTLTADVGAQSGVNVAAANSDAFRERMKALVAQCGSIAEIARKCGIAESTVKKWVDGISDPSRSRCIALAQGTGVSLIWLVAGEGPMRTPETAPLRESHVVGLDRETITSAVKLLAWAFELQGATYDAARDPDLLAETYAFLVEHGGSVTPDNLVDFSKRLAERRAQEASRAKQGGGGTGSGNGNS